MHNSMQSHLHFLFFFVHLSDDDLIRPLAAILFVAVMVMVIVIAVARSGNNENWND